MGFNLFKYFFKKIHNLHKYLGAPTAVKMKKKMFWNEFDSYDNINRIERIERKGRYIKIKSNETDAFWDKIKRKNSYWNKKPIEKNFVS